MKPDKKNQAERILELMICGSRVLGLRLSLHDYHQRTGLPSEWLQHHTACCLSKKEAHNDICTPYCVTESRQALLGRPCGAIRTCPFGYTDLVIPVIVKNLPVGLLFAGSCWVSGGPPPAGDLIVPPDANWLADRLVLLRGVARQLAHLIDDPGQGKQDNRRRQILEFLENRKEDGPALMELASALCLSPSRMGHVVQELFGCSLSVLAHRVRIQRATVILVSTDLPVGQVADLVGYNDSNYFTYIFHKHMKMSPRAYRKHYGVQA